MNKERKYSDMELIRRLWKYFIQNNRYLLSVIFFMLLAIGITVYLPLIASMIIDDAIGKNNLNLLYLLVGTYLGLVTISMIIEYIARYFIAIIGESAKLNLRKDVFVKIQSHSQDYFDDTPTGDTVSRITNDISSMGGILSGNVIFTIIQVFQIIGMVIVMLQKSLILTGFSVIIIPLSIVSMWLHRKFMRSEYKIVRREVGEVSAAITENIQGVRVSAAFARMDENTKEFEEINNRFGQTLYRYYRNVAFVGPISPMLTIITITLVLISGTLLIDGGAEGITIGVLYLFIIYTQRLANPVIQISAVFNQIQNAFGAFERILTLIDAPSSITESENAYDLDISDAAIEMKNVVFSYKKDSAKILENFNLTINPGETIAIVGSTGAGKSTIPKIISRLYDIQSGKVLIDNQDIREVTLTSIRNNIGVVLQEPILYSDSIRNNLLLAKQVDDQKLQSILQLVGAEFVFDLEKGLDTVVGERGSRLSLGQKQLISFARALVHDPKILFLDEATSSIDSQAELRIQRAMDEMLKDKTSIIIAHRLSTVKKADRIIVLSKGQIIEQGSFGNLIKQEGYFYELYKMQFNGNGN